MSMKNQLKILYLTSLNFKGRNGGIKLLFGGISVKNEFDYSSASNNLCRSANM